MRRGRPRYPDLLTSREQEVLSLLRKGLTNEQIASRLGISESGAFSGSLPDAAMLAPALRGGTMHGFFGPPGRATNFYVCRDLLRSFRNGCSARVNRAS